MANYSLVINSKFQPFSFERYMQPLQIYAQLYDQERAAMEQQAMQYGLLSSMVDPEVDRAVYERMQQYNDNLMRQRDILSTVGLTPQGRRDLSALRQQYFTDVAPVQNWVNMRNKDIEAQRNLELQTNGNVRFNKRAAETSLDYYRTGKQLDYKTMNLNAAMAEASALIQAISKRHVETGQRPLGDYIESYKTTGYASLNELMANPEAKSALESVLNKYGFNSSDFTDEDKSALYQAVQEGANGGLAYDTTSHFNPNWRAQGEFNMQKSMELERYKKELDESYGNKFIGYDADGNGIYVDKDGDSFTLFPDGTKQYDPYTMHSLGYKLNGSNSNSSSSNGSSSGDTSLDVPYLPQNSITLQMAPPKGGKEESVDQREAMKRLGIDENRNANGNVTKRKVKLYADRVSGAGTNYKLRYNIDMNKQHDNSEYLGQFSVFDSNNKLLSKDAFVSSVMKEFHGTVSVPKGQGKAINTADAIKERMQAMRKSLEEYYDKNIKGSVDLINKSDGGKRNTVLDLHKQATTRAQRGSNANISVMPIPFGDTDQAKILDDIISRNGGVYRLKGSVYDYKTNSKRDNVDKFFASLPKRRGDSRYSMQMYIVNSKDPYTGTDAQGILIQAGGNSWFIPKDELGDSARNGFATWNSPRMTQIRAEYNQRLQQGYTPETDQYTEYLKNIIDTEGSTGLRGILQDVGLQYNMTDVKTIKQQQ